MKTQGQKRDLRASALSISEESTLDLLYSTETCRLFSGPKYGLQLMSDGYIIENALLELRDDECFSYIVTTYVQESWSV